MEAEKLSPWSAVSQLDTQGRQWCECQSESESKGRRSRSQLKDSQAESICSLSAFYSIQAFNEPHPHWGGWSVLFRLPVQVLISFRNTLPDTLRNNVCNGLNVYVPLKFICWNPKPQGNSIRRWESLKCDRVVRVEPLWKSLVPFIRETLERSLPPFTMWGDREKTAVWEVGPQQTLNLLVSLSWTPASRTVRSTFLLSISHSVYAVLL